MAGTKSGAVRISTSIARFVSTPSSTSKSSEPFVRVRHSSHVAPEAISFITIGSYLRPEPFSISKNYLENRSPYCLVYYSIQNRVRVPSESFRGHES